mgnify:CR=1 FL=1
MKICVLGLGYVGSVTAAMLAQSGHSVIGIDIDAHKVWMIRNFSLTFGAVTLRLYMGLFSAFYVDPSEAFQAVAWLAWVPNLIVVEWYLNSKLNTSHFIGVE